MADSRQHFRPSRAPIKIEIVPIEWLRPFCWDTGRQFIIFRMNNSHTFPIHSTLICSPSQSQCPDWPYNLRPSTAAVSIEKLFHFISAPKPIIIRNPKSDIDFGVFLVFSSTRRSQVNNVDNGYHLSHRILFSPFGARTQRYGCVAFKLKTFETESWAI